jgi:hypothetical protein
MLDRSPRERQEMGRLGRSKIEQEFCETVVISRYLDAIRSR